MKHSNLKKFYQGKRVLVTGHTGFKGAWLSRILLEWGAKVYGFSLNPNTTPNLFATLDLEKLMTHQIGDIADLPQFQLCVEKAAPDIIFHLAAQPLVRDSYDDPHNTYNTNIMGTVNVLESVRKHNIPACVIVTTDKVYKNKERNIAYKEDDPLGGYDPYSNSKSCADLVVTSYINSFFNPSRFGNEHRTLVASARAGNVIGGGDWAKDRLIPDAVRAFLDKKEDLIVRSPNAIRPWQHVFEPLYGYLLLAENLSQGNLDAVGAWNFGPDAGDMQPVKEILDLMIDRLGKGKYIVKADPNKHEATNLKLDNSKARKKLHWQPQFNLKEAIAETFNWYETFYTNRKTINNLSVEQINNYFGD